MGRKDANPIRSRADPVHPKSLQKFQCYSRLCTRNYDKMYLSRIKFNTPAHTLKSSESKLRVLWILLSAVYVT